VDEALAAGLDAAIQEATAALSDLRELARGIHPAMLDRGLAAALRPVARRAPLEVKLEVGEERYPPPVEAAAYYVVAEALTNVAKYSGASTATVRAKARDGLLLVEVADDGVGGADAARGTGLRGLLDRVAALDGTLEVESPPGAGTRVRARIPLATPAE
jgi:signal transduction histidine kinase